MTMNFLQNFTTTDLTLIGLGLLVFNYSLYCLYTQSIPLGYKTIDFSDNMTDSLETESINSINTTDTITNNVTQSSQITDRIDEVIGLLKAEGPNIYHLSDEALKDRILTILRGLCSEGDDLSDVSTMRQSVFDTIIREDPGNRDWFGFINSWVNTTQISSSSSSTNYQFEKLDEQIEIISSVIREIKSHLTNNLVVPHINDPTLNTDLLRNLRFDEFINYCNTNLIEINNISSIWVRTVIDSYDYLQLMSPNFNHFIFNDLVGVCF